MHAALVSQVVNTVTFLQCDAFSNVILDSVNMASGDEDNIFYQIYKDFYYDDFHFWRKRISKECSYAFMYIYYYFTLNLHNTNPNIFASKCIIVCNKKYQIDIVWNTLLPDILKYLIAWNTLLPEISNCLEYFIARNI